MQPGVEPRLFQAEWLLGRLAPDALPQLAAGMLAQGRDGPGLRVLAGMSRPDREEARNVVEATFADLGLQPMTRGEAAWTVVKALAQKIIDGEISPYEGAREIGTIADQHRELTSLKVFSGLASEWEDDLPHRTRYEEFILEEASDLLGE